MNVDSLYKTVIESLINTYLPQTIIPKNKFKLKDKPWITATSIKTQYLPNFMRLNNTIKRDEDHVSYKYYRNLLSTLLKKSKQNFY